MQQSYLDSAYLRPPYFFYRQWFPPNYFLKFKELKKIRPRGRISVKIQLIFSCCEAFFPLQ
ncbi:hypothetical protein D4R51_04460 [bacterium]|nr:MAG: hypothetical protein D4R51_04460 [bacterium]